MHQLLKFIIYAVLAVVCAYFLKMNTVGIVIFTDDYRLDLRLNFILLILTFFLFLLYYGRRLWMTSRKLFGKPNQ